jgi:hypothetical protein
MLRTPASLASMAWAAMALLGCAAGCGPLFCHVARAQAPPALFEPTKVNAARLRWLDYKMMAGRIVSSSTYPPDMNISFGPSVIGGRLREHLQLVILENHASVQYELSGHGQSLSIVMAQDGEFTIDRRRTEPKYAMRYREGPRTRPTLSVDDGPLHETVAADSFWHLLLARPELVRIHVVPYLELLRPNWQLSATGCAVEESLFEKARHPQAIDTARWRSLVDALASPNFAARERAQRDLLGIGQSILPFLEGLDRGSLDAEQLARVDALRASLALDYEDTAERVAMWLMADRRVWLSLLDRDQESKRRIAAAQLASLVGRAIDFDPAADEATRRVQVERLRQAFAPATVDAAMEPGPADAGGDDVKNGPSVPPPGPDR